MALRTPKATVVKNENAAALGATGRFPYFVFLIKYQFDDSKLLHPELIGMWLLQHGLGVSP